ncbi:cytochrome C oxidase subunit IV family protein [Crenobacter caeni]|uniref:Cytochrome C oxidase subunit IV family protein n=1 Tax=Crenobacter caeni TaxID=2705474 RepID=A0A6B2KVK4_9NEIS|nr:cytochrome C oxidase subunit IV family protein [Crenobacter caeni]NDV14033.1 hypothetical protein [Crenobacter caeni]
MESKPRLDFPLLRLIVVLLLLLGLSLVQAGGEREAWPMSVFMLFAWLKGALIAEYFMALAWAPWVWRLLIHVWLLLVCAGLALSFF